MPEAERTIEKAGALKAGLRKARKLAGGDIARASAASLFIRVFGLTLSFAQAVLMARLLGASGYGMVAVAMSIVQILATVSMLGFGPLAVREIPAGLAADSRSSVAAFVRLAFLAVLGLSLTAGLVLAIVASLEVVGPAYRPVLEIGGLLMVPLALINLFRGVAQGFGRIVLAQVPGEVVRPAVLVLIMLIFAALGGSFMPANFMWSAAGAALAAATAAGAWLWARDLARLPHAQNRTDPGQFTLALPFLGLALTTMLQGEINTLLLGWLATPRETGLFQPIIRFTPVLALPVTAAGMRFAPRIAELWQKGETDRIRWVTATFTWTTSLLTLGVALAIAAAGPVLMWMFGREFHESAPLLWYVAAAQVFNASCGPVGMLLTMGGQSGGALGGQIAGLAVNVAVGLVLIPAHGAWGAVIAMVAGIVVWNLTMLAMTLRRYGFDPSLVGALWRGGGTA